MARKLVGALTIGQSPRPDLIEPLRRMLPPGWAIAEAGALDGLAPTSIPPPSEALYPLVTRLRDGSPVMVEEAFLLPWLQHALRKLEAKEVSVSILLCAGTFAALHAQRPFVKPFDIACADLQARGLHTLGLITPVQEQETPLRRRWQAAGFNAAVWTADITTQDDAFRHQLQTQIARHALDCILLDYVGHPPATVEELQQNSPLPLFDLGQMAMRALLHLL